MAQYCSTCGMEMTYYHQNQSWYCQQCQKYAGPVIQGAIPQPMYYTQPPPPMPNENLARSRIYGAMRMRDTTDKIIPTSWAFALLAFQIIMPVLIILMVYLLLIEIDIDLSNTGLITIVLIMFIASVAMVIIQAVLIYKLVGRRDEHFRRDGMIRQGMMEYLDAMSIKEQKDINVERWTMNTMHFSAMEHPRSPGLWAMMVGLTVIIPIIGIFALFYSLNFLTKDVHEHDKHQRDFNGQFQMAMFKLGKVNTISYDWQPLPRRDSGVYILVSILTLSFFLPYWWYVNIVDMNTHMRNQWNFESQLIRMIKERPDEVPAQS